MKCLKNYSINMGKWSIEEMTKSLPVQRLMMMLKACHVSIILNF
uniref:Uncharacterized protein MANES_14G016400 n=1 Tax=Rhizophora mucronata TaxID=61149 RepID=A0A2P2K1P8_RHIMU